MSGFVKAGQTFLKALMSGGKQKTTGTEVIKNVPIAKNIDTKRAIQDKVTKTVDTAFKKADLPPSVRDSIETKNKKAALKRDEGKKLKNLSYRLDKLQEKVEKKAKGGRVGLKFGSKKSNVQKIKETFGPKKKVPNKFKGFSKLPEKVQKKINSKLAKKV